MKRSHLILTGAWLLSLVAVFLIGRNSSIPAPSAERGGLSELARGPARKSSRDSRAARPFAPEASPSRSPANRIVSARTPRQAVVDLAGLSDPVERARGILALIETLTAEEYRDVVADFRALGITEQRMSEYGMLLHAWGKAAPEDALAYALKETGTPFARQTILASWAADDPAAAEAFARDHHEGEGANPLMVGVIKGVAPNDISRASQLLQDLPYSRERGSALQSMLPFVMQNGVEVALRWTEGIGDDRLRSGALTYILNDLSQSEPQTAAEVVKNLGDEEAAARVADDVGRSLARANLDEALAWSATLSPNVQAEAAEGIIGSYAAQDPQSALQWLDSLSDTTNLDAAVQRFAWTSRRKDPWLAAESIERVQNDRTRHELYSGVLSRWLDADRESAAQWIQGRPDLPEDILRLAEQPSPGTDGVR